jgi:hypothetical protein
MRNRLMVVLFGASLFAAPMLVGCDRQVAHEESTKTRSDGSTAHNETTVKEKPDGTVVKETEKSVNR